MPHRVALLVCHVCGIAVKPFVCHWCVMAREDLHFRLRIPEQLKAELESAAKANRRSMTAEIVSRISQTFRQPPLPDHMIEDIEAIAERDDQPFGAVFHAVVDMGLRLEEFRDQDIPVVDAARIFDEIRSVSDRLAQIEQHLQVPKQPTDPEIDF